MGRPAPRWDGDQRGIGIGDGRWIEDDVLSLLEALSAPAWVTEDPDLHLLPHLQRACAADGSRFTIASHELRDTVYTVVLNWNGSLNNRGQIRAAVYALLGEISEGVSFIRQRIGDGQIEFVACTGMLDGDGPFAAHGHLIHFIVRESTERRID
jgi:hypothetical protein